MLKILLPNDNEPERLYAAESILVNMLGLKVQFISGSTPYSAEIKLPNGKELVFEDHFFQKFPSPLSYLHNDNIPKQCSYYNENELRWLPGKRTPILFGNKNFIFQGEKLILGIDLFAGVFFMLSRWEEHVNTWRDTHGRFPCHASLAYKSQFLHIPLVDLYTELLWNLLSELGYEQPRKKRQFKFCPTHDVDQALMWPSWFSIFKKAGGDILKRHDISAARYSIKSGFQTKILSQKDPYDSFDYLMDKSDKAGLQSIFYFLCGGQTKHDASIPLDTPFMKELMIKIQDRGHIIGLHPSYQTIEHPILLEQEKKLLEKTSGFPIRHSRQHFLRFEIPTTWQLLEDSGIEWDSSLYYPEQAGFRCGTCHPFPVFNILSRKKLRLKEVPLTAMEVTWTSYSKSTPTQMLADMGELLATVKAYQGEFVLLWHNSSFNTPEWEPYRKVYTEIYDNL